MDTMLTSQTKEYVSISINIFSWQDPLQLGIKLKATPCGTPWYRWDGFVQRVR